MPECQRIKATFLPMEPRPCGHLPDFTVYVPREERTILLCGCCFIELTKSQGFVWLQAVIDIRTGMMIPPQSAPARAARLN